MAAFQHCVRLYFLPGHHAAATLCVGNQNRIARLEFRLRYFELFGKSSRDAEGKLSFGQIAALRFADDHEFGILLDRALRENISSDEIKKAISNWQADDMRV